MSHNTVELTDATFASETAAALPTLVDFWAPWCGPCRMIAPTLEALAVSHAGKLRVGKLNVDEHPLSSQQHEVQGIPTLILFHKGKVAARWVGAVPANQLNAAVDQALAGLPK